jgi:ribosomal protein S18 acetylase RimI-like enzyme
LHCKRKLMQHIIIKKKKKNATESDGNMLTEIGRKTFQETYADRNSEADMQSYIQESFTHEALNKQLQNPNTEFYIAWDADQPIGYLKLNTAEAQTDLNESDSIEIERIYVLADYHGRNVGQQLYQTAVEAAQAKNKTSIWLGVWEQNPRAIRFYEKNGFLPFAKHIFKVGNDEQTDHLMRKKL